jgi:IclR family transcriptional regulator, KDG regulon repressor
MGNSVERSIRLLTLLAGSEAPATVSEIAASLDTSVASASRMIQTLIDAGAIQRNEQSGRLEIALDLVQIGAAALRPLEFRRVILPSIAAALPELQRPVNIGVPSRDNGIWLESVSGNGGLITSTLKGIPIPYHASTLGKAMLAYLPRERAEQILSRKLHRYTDKTILSSQELRSEVASIRETRIALNRGEFREGGLAVAAPLIDGLGQAVAAFSVPASSHELDAESPLVRSLTSLGQSISQLLGYTGDAHESFV